MGTFPRKTCKENIAICTYPQCGYQFDGLDHFEYECTHPIYTRQHIINVFKEGTPQEVENLILDLNKLIVWKNSPKPAEDAASNQERI